MQIYLIKITKRFPCSSLITNFTCNANITYICIIMIHHALEIVSFLYPLTIIPLLIPNPTLLFTTPTPFQRDRKTRFNAY